MLSGCVATAAWVAAIGFNARWWVVAALDQARLGTWLLFFLASLGLLRPSDWAAWGAPRRIAQMSAALAAIPLLGGALLVAGGHYGVGTATIYQLALDSAVLLLFENLLRNQARPLGMLASLVPATVGAAFAADLFYNASMLLSGHVEPGFLQLRIAAAAVGWPLLALGAARGNLWHLEISLSRRLVFHSTALLAIGFYLVVTALGGEAVRRHGGIWGPAFELGFLAMAVFVLLVAIRSPALRARLVVLTTKHFFRLKYDYREVWLQFIERMANPAGEEALAQRCLDGVAKALHCEFGALWARSAAIDGYALCASLPVGAQPAQPDALRLQQLVEFLQRTEWVIDIAECRRDPRRYEGLHLPSALSSLPDPWVITPLIHRRALEGFLVLGKPTGDAAAVLGWEELDLLKTLGAQVAGHLAEERATRELLDAQRLGDFNQRFAFVVHDVKNVVGQMSMLLKNAERFGDDPEFQRDMLTTIASSTARLQGLLTNLTPRAQANPHDFAPQDFELSAALEPVHSRWSANHPGFTGQIGAGSFHVLGDPAKLQSALDHLIANAAEATGPGGSVALLLSKTDEEGIIDIVDDGSGMDAQFIRERLFRPLESTKAQGTGIGAYQALRLLRGMGALLEVDSQPGKGTTMRVRLKRPIPSV